MTIFQTFDYETGDDSQHGGKQDATTLTDRSGVATVVTSDEGGTITPEAGPTTVAMSRFTTEAHFDTPNGKFDAAEYLTYSDHPNGTAPGSNPGVTEYFSFAFYFPSASNWDQDFFPATFPRWFHVCQLTFRGKTAASVALSMAPAGFEGTSALSMHLMSQGGYTDPGTRPEDCCAIDPNAGNGWDTHFGPPPVSDGLPGEWRKPQVIGPNTFLAGNVPLTLDVWHQLILKIKWAATTFDGSAEVWHRQLGAGAAWTKTYEVFGRKNWQHDGDSNNPDPLHKYGAYCKAVLPLRFYHDQLGRSSTFADAETFFTPGGVAQLAQVGFRGYRADVFEGVAAENTNFVWPVDETVALRFEVQETGGAPSSTTAQLQASLNGGAYFNVTGASTIARSADASAYSDGASTGDQLTGGTGTFTNGYYDEVDGLTPSVEIPANGHTEYMFGVQLLSADVVAGDEVEFRLALSGDSEPTYTQTPLVTVAGAALHVISGVGNIASAEAVGQPVTGGGAALHVVSAVGGISSLEAFGQPHARRLLTQLLGVGGITSAEAFGGPRVGDPPAPLPVEMLLSGALYRIYARDYALHRVDADTERILEVKADERPVGDVGWK